MDGVKGTMDTYKNEMNEMQEDVKNVDAKMETGLRYAGFKGRRCATGSR